MAKDKEFEASYKIEKKKRSIIRKQKRKSEKGSLTICPKCHQDRGYFIHKHINPYYSEINGIEVWEKMCHDCYESACGDI